MIKPNPNNVIVKIKSQFKSKTKSGLNFNPIFRKYHNVVYTGEVVGVPSDYDSMPIYQEYDGHPCPKAYMPKPPFSANMHSPIKFTVADTLMDVEIGDTVYFHYLSIQFFEEGRKSKSYIYTDEDGFEHHRVGVDQLFCSVREGKINMLLGYVLIEPIMDEKGSKKSSGLINKVESAPRYLQGVVRHAGAGVGSQNINSVSSGDMVLYLPKSEFKNNIEGKDYFVMKQWHLVAKKEREEDEYTPIGSFVRIKKDSNSTSELIKIKEEPVMNGVVDFMGELCGEDINPGNNIMFESRSVFFVDHKEGNRIFVRYEDVYGKVAV